MTSDKRDKIIRISAAAALIALSLVSIFVFSKHASSTSFYPNTIEALDEKKTTVMELTAASTAASAALTILPGDTVTPIAEKLADLSGYFLIVLCAIFLEKYLLTITGYASFTILIPAALALFAGNLYFRNRTVRQLASKLLLLGLAMFLVVPTSVWVSDMIEDTYNASINETIDSAKEATEIIEGSVQEEENKDEDESGGFLSSLISKVTDSASGLTEKAKDLVSNFLEALAVMIVTSCLIPIAVIIFFIWLIKVILGVDISVPRKKL